MWPGNYSYITINSSALNALARHHCGILRKKNYLKPTCLMQLLEILSLKKIILNLI